MKQDSKHNEFDALNPKEGMGDWRCPGGRISFKPSWDKTQPWVTYSNGTAGLHFANIHQAINYMENK